MMEKMISMMGSRRRMSLRAWRQLLRLGFNTIPHKMKLDSTKGETTSARRNIFGKNIKNGSSRQETSSQRTNERENEIGPVWIDDWMKRGRGSFLWSKLPLLLCFEGIINACRIPFFGHPPKRYWWWRLIYFVPYLWKTRKWVSNLVVRVGVGEKGWSQEEVCCAKYTHGQTVKNGTM